MPKRRWNSTALALVAAALLAGCGEGERTSEPDLPGADEARALEQAGEMLGEQRLAPPAEPDAAVENGAAAGN